MVENRAFENKELHWKVDDISIYGTLTQPTGMEPVAAVVFVAGSGPTDRDWCSPLLPGKNGSGKLLAEELASQGYLTLRFDKSASGPHVQENISKLIGKISMQSHVNELKGAVEILVTQKYTVPNNLFVLTNSEGAIHAVNYQLQTKTNLFKGLILTGAPGRSIGDVARTQIQNQIATAPNAQTIMKNYDEAINQFTAGNKIVPDPSLPDGIKNLLLSLATPVNLPFVRELWTYNLSETIKQIQQPTLVIIGKKDIQIDHQTDGKALQEATNENPQITFIYPENADHILKYEEIPMERINPTQATLKYNSPDRKLDQETTKAILNWLNKQDCEKRIS